MTRLYWFGLGVAIGVLCVVVGSLWADERNQRFYQATEHRHWQDWTG